MLGAGKTLADALIPPAMPLPLTDRLYRNDLTVAADGTRTLRFTDVTAESGLGVSGYGMGAATGDFDNDGWVDLYRTRRGPDKLFRNNGDGTFADVSGPGARPLHDGLRGGEVAAQGVQQPFALRFAAEDAGDEADFRLGAGDGVVRRDLDQFDHRLQLLQGRRGSGVAGRQHHVRLQGQHAPRRRGAAGSRPAAGG